MDDVVAGLEPIEEFFPGGGVVRLLSLSGYGMSYLAGFHVPEQGCFEFGEVPDGGGLVGRQGLEGFGEVRWYAPYVDMGGVVEGLSFFF